MSPGLYNSFLWFFLHKLRHQNTKLPKRITLALANIVYIRRNTMYFPLSKYFPKIENYWYIGFFQSKDVSKAFLLDFLTFIAIRAVLVEVLVDKNQEKLVYLRMFPKSIPR